MSNAPEAAAARPPVGNDKPFIRLDRVTKRYGARLILDAITLEFRAGETVAIIGPSGGGKSTLIRCINGLTSIDDGQISVGPHTLTAGNGGVARDTLRQIRLQVGMVFQDFQLFPHLTALENVIEAPVRVLGKSAADAGELAQKLLKRVGLGERSDAYPQQLSGGQKQRVAIARALAMQPQGLLCDEITSALDPELKYEVLQALEDLQGEGMTLLVVTHEMGFARRAADRVLVLADGHVIDDGPPADVLENPRTPRTQAFLRNLLA